MTFGQAIEYAKQGKKIQRSGWNGKNQHVELGTGFTWTDSQGVHHDSNHDQAGNAALIFVGTSGTQVGWLASQADMLAEDWRITE